MPKKNTLTDIAKEELQELIESGAAVEVICKHQNQEDNNSVITCLHCNKQLN